MTINKMSDLVDKIERRLGTRRLNLPEELAKDKWPEIIIKDSITTFSRYYPNKYKLLIDQSMYKDGWYYIDEYLNDDMELLGIKDINWDDFSQDSLSCQQAAGYGYYDVLSTSGLIGAVDILQAQCVADQTSMYNFGIYVEWDPMSPNRFRLKNVTNGMLNIQTFPIDIFIKHAPNLMTISPTKMETFERLATADIATWLFGELKYFDGLETVYASMELRMQDLEKAGDDRDNVVQKLEESYISAGNGTQPMIICQ